jgi:hypothetical protein
MFSNENDSIINLLALKLSNWKTTGSITTAKLCNEMTQYHCNGYCDNWSCGYQNCKNILSSLQKFHQYRRLFLENPDISSLQAYLESAWASGFDPEGSRTFDGSIIGKHDWIGTTEIASILSYLGIKYNHLT